MSTADDIATGQPGHIQQIVMNLVQNAMDAMEDVEVPEIRLTVRKRGKRATLEVAGRRPGVTDPARNGAGIGLVKAARGSLGHWLRIERGRIANDQIIAPTTWNFSPRIRTGVPGAVEMALEGAPVRPGETTPIAVQHIVRSFDPCMVCTVH
jgi:Ni,Fe-hydrogenase I large subunit